MSIFFLFNLIIMLFLESRSGASSIAKEKGLIHIGSGYYSDNSGNIIAKSCDGATLTNVKKSDIFNTNKKLNKFYTQKDDKLPNPLGDAFGKKEPLIKPKKKKSLVEFYNHAYKSGLWKVNYQIPGTGKKIHYILIDAINPREASIKIKSFINNVRLVGQPKKCK